MIDDPFLLIIYSLVSGSDVGDEEAYSDSYGSEKQLDALADHLRKGSSH